ncbi:phospholipid phosphatase-related protein type 5 [Mesoplodon densirostris]|uniref:phospholipid phosphatase-related protein type 5 n=1 Tax=Mesoplodon densirostris TaxID=48708 RepID=UPI0028DB04A9|nr:phospholipid phosphatase-related protein type 5 [Mesoplodon densirostris]
MPRLPAALTSSMLYFQMVIMAGTVMLAYYFEYTDTFTVNVQGFFCHDSAYRKPYPGPEDSSAVPPVLLYSLAAGVPVLVIIVGETAVFCLQLATRDFENQEKTILTGDCCYINPLVRRTVRFLGIYTFGLFATDIFVNAGQVVTGNLAPHFLALCKPNYTALGCQQYTQFISGEEACTGNPDLIMRARKTFPSKEAALSVYAAMYLTMYITNTIKAKGTRLAKPVLCLGLMCLAFLTGLNRVAEYRNHWSDVIAGFLVGISIAVFLVVCVVNNFKGRQPENEHIHTDNLAQMPMISIPRVESPLEKVTSVQDSLATTSSSNAGYCHHSIFWVSYCSLGGSGITRHLYLPMDTCASSADYHHSLRAPLIFQALQQPLLRSATSSRNYLIHSTFRLFPWGLPSHERSHAKPTDYNYEGQNDVCGQATKENKLISPTEEIQEKSTAMSEHSTSLFRNPFGEELKPLSNSQHQLAICVCECPWDLGNSCCSPVKSEDDCSTRGHLKP